MTEELTEDSFLRDRTSQCVHIYLLSGIKLIGLLEGHHSDVVFLRQQGARSNDVQMISKCAISTIVLAPSNDDQSPTANDLEGVLRRPRRDWRGVRDDEDEHRLT